MVGPVNPIRPGSEKLEETVIAYRGGFLQKVSNIWNNLFHDAHTKQTLRLRSALAGGDIDSAKDALNRGASIQALIDSKDLIEDPIRRDELQGYTVWKVNSAAVDITLRYAGRRHGDKAFIISKYSLDPPPYQEPPPPYRERRQ